MPLRLLLPILLIGLFLSACQTPLPRTSSTAAGVSHVVICWLKEPGNSAARSRVISAAQRLRQIPGVATVEAGEVLPSRRPVVDSSFDVALVIRFENERALRAYHSHPIHREMVREVVRPLVRRFVVYDFSAR